VKHLPGVLGIVHADGEPQTCQIVESAAGNRFTAPINDNRRSRKSAAEIRRLVARWIAFA
jgi:hypothetical protein